jgi:transposase InsO family protein
LRGPVEPKRYAAETCRSALAHSGITPSISHNGDCWDNAPMESLKTDRVQHRVYATRAEARLDLFGYMGGLLQSRPPALSPGLHQPRRDGAQNGLTPSTFSERINMLKQGVHLMQDARHSLVQNDV